MASTDAEIGVATSSLEHSSHEHPPSSGVEMTTVNNGSSGKSTGEGGDMAVAGIASQQPTQKISPTNTPEIESRKVITTGGMPSDSIDASTTKDFTPVGAAATSASGEAASPPEAEVLKVGITLLMPTGHRSEWRFDSKYLEKRNVNVPEGNPFKISVYTLKELMLREWRTEWGPKPSSPSAIRLITLGKLLDDKSSLEDCKFTDKALTILHMTVKPQDMMDEEDAKISKHASGRDREGSSRRFPCSCVIL